jgi:glycosyltransferase involved in cell wall biosynthesis
MGRLACSLDFDLIHVYWDFNLFAEGFEAWLQQLKRAGKKLAVSLQEVKPDAPVWPTLIKAADVLIASSHEHLRDMLVAGCPASKTGCLEPCLVPIAPISRHEARQKLVIPEKAKIVVTFGYWSERKGVLELIAAFAALRPHPETHLYVLGTPDRVANNSTGYLQKCRARAKKLGVSEQVHFIERHFDTEELQQYLAAADVVALPYVFDQYYWSHAAAEALAAGCAVIVSPAKAFLPFGDAVLRLSTQMSLSQALRDLLDNPALAGQLRAKARAFAEAHPRLDSYRETWKLYQSLVNGGPVLAFPRPTQIADPCSETIPNAGQPRVVWEGPQMINHSLALVNRELELALIESRQVHLSIRPVGADNFNGNLPPSKRTLEEFYGKTLPGAAEIHVRHQWPPNWIPPTEGHWVVIQPWEYGSLPCQWVQEINAGVDEAWVPTSFVRDLYVASGVSRIRVQVIPNGVDIDIFKPGVKPFPLPAKKGFRFLFLGGTIPRKGIDLLLKAYQKAFSAADEVQLVIKDMGTRDLYQGQTMEERIKQLQADASFPSLLYLGEDLSENQISSLYNACHCLVHPYRGEGFGLPVLEAMSCALPVITTAGGATDDFVDDQTGYRIPAQRQVFGNREISGLKTVGDLWMLEPDVDALARQMRWVYEHPEEARHTGQKARRKVEEGWTWKHAAEKALLRIEALRKMPIYRHLEKFDMVAVLRFEPNPTAHDQAALYAATVDSLQKNSYARMKILIQPRSANPDLVQQLNGINGVEILSEVDFPTDLKQILERFSASYLAVIQSPARFSKQWFGQLALIGGNAPGTSKMLAPSTDKEGSSCFVQMDGADDEMSFQRFCRQLWRTNRGQSKTSSELPSDVACVSWSCLEKISPNCTSPHAWYEHLMQHDVKLIQALDTFVSIKE